MNAPAAAQALVIASTVFFAMLFAPFFEETATGHEDGDHVEVTLTETGNENVPFAFEPHEITVGPGTTVRWVLDHDVFHTVTSTNSQQERRPNDVFDTSLSSQGDTFEFTFEENGVYPYYCKPHSNFMSGTVIVGGGDDETTTTPASGTGILILALLGLLLVVRHR